MGAFQFDPKRVLFEGEDFLIYDVRDKMPRHKNFPHGTDVLKPNGSYAIPPGWKFREVKDRQVDTLYVHQTAGAVTYDGFDALFNTYAFMMRDPAYDSQGHWTGAGRGWPSGSYTWYIPYNPIVHDGKVVIFQCWGKDWITWHSSDNHHSVAIVCQGYFKSRHMGSFKAKKGCPGGKPSDLQTKAITGFIREYAIGEMGIAQENVKGHCHSPTPKPACPGDDLESMVKTVQTGGEDWAWPNEALFADPTPTSIQLADWKQRQAALVLLGHDIGNYGPKGNGVDGDPGDMTRMAIETQEELWGLEVDGYWDDRFDFMVRSKLEELNWTNEDIKDLC